MTLLCGGGTSGPTFGASAVTDITVGVLGELVSQYGMGWALTAAPFLSIAPLVLSTFCATDPPAIPTFTLAESNAITQLQFGPDFTSGLAKVGDLVQHLAWYKLCTCTSGVQVTLPAATAPPTGTPIALPLDRTSAPCGVPDIVTPFLMSAGNSNNISAGGWLGTGAPNSALNATMLRIVTKSNPVGGGPHFPLSLSVSFSDINGLPAGSFGPWALRVNYPDEQRIPIVAPEAGFVFHAISDPSETGISLVTTIEYWCNGSLPGVLNSPCCPPDTTTQATLDAILSMVTLIQRQSSPFAYVASTQHAGLTGAGQFPVQGLIGLSVALTAGTAFLGSESGDPTAIFEAGWITTGTADGWQRSRRIDHNPLLVLPIDGAESLVGYTLHPGVSATITELKREA